MTFAPLNNDIQLGFGIPVGRYWHWHWQAFLGYFFFARRPHVAPSNRIELHVFSFVGLTLPMSLELKLTPQPSLQLRRPVLSSLLSLLP